MRFYLDHNASTPADPRVLECFQRVEAEHGANPASLHRAGRKARGVLEAARQRIAAALAVPSDDVLFVSGGTEANNTVVLGCGDPGLPVLAAATEHPSVLVPAQQRGWAELSVNPEGRIRFEPPSQSVGLLAVVHGQSELGTVQDLAAARRLADDLGVPLHVDAAQTIGRCPWPAGGADSWAISCHKLGGIRGFGVLVASAGGRGLRPLLRGGAQERGLRAGTASPALAAANALAIELAVHEQAARAAAMAAARDAFLDHIAPHGRCLTHRAVGLPNTAMVAFAGVDGRLLLPALDVVGVEASAGSACSSGSPEPPRILGALGMDDNRARQCVRFSFAPTDELQFAVEAAHAVVNAIVRLRNTNSGGVDSVIPPRRES